MNESFEIDAEDAETRREAVTERAQQSNCSRL